MLDEQRENAARYLKDRNLEYVVSRENVSEAVFKTGSRSFQMTIELPKLGDVPKSAPFIEVTTQSISAFSKHEMGEALEIANRLNRSAVSGRFTVSEDGGLDYRLKWTVSVDVGLDDFERALSAAMSDAASAAAYVDKRRFKSMRERWLKGPYVP